MGGIERLREYFRSSLARKFMLSIVLVDAILIGAIGWELNSQDQIERELRQVKQAETMVRVLATAVNGEPRPDLQKTAAAAVDAGSVALVKFQDGAGRTVAEARARGAGPDSLQGPREIRTGGPVRVVRTKGLILASGPIATSGGMPGTVKVGVSRSDVVSFYRRSLLSLAALGAAIILLGGLVAYLTAHSITERLANLAQVADRFRLGERGARLSDRGSDEVATTARGFNAMLVAITDSEQALKEVCRIALIGSWRFSPADRRLELSETLEEILGFSDTHSPTAKDLETFLSPRQRRRLTELLKSGDASRRYSFTFIFKARDAPPKHLWVEARVDSPAGGPILLGICQDITERESKDAQLRQAQKMEVVGQLTGGLAHDFNNLLAIIVGNLDLLQEEVATGASAKELTGEALTAALRGAELTRQLLAFSRRQPLSPHRVDLNRLVTEMVPLWRRTLTEAIEVRTHLADELWPTFVDPSQLESALLNMVVNARDAMPNGGVLAIETANAAIAGGDWSDPEESGIAAGDYAIVSVTDNGSGMTPDVVGRAFEPFFTTKAVGKGSGLGLSMIYGFARQSGGSVKIYSEPGVGTTIRLYLPRHSAKASEALEAEASEPVAGAGGERILLVEDNEAVRRVVERQLGDLGYQVLSAGNAREALDVLEGDEAVDLLFTDVVMPGGMNGFELGRHALKLRPSLKVLHTTGFTRPIDEFSDSERPPYLLTKPYRKTNLAIKLRQVLDGAA